MNYIEKHNQLLKSLGLPVSSSENLSIVQENHPQIKKKELILCMNIDLGEKTENLNIFSDDVIEEKAKWFCSKYDLNEDAVELLVENIKQNLEDYYRKKRNGKNGKNLDEDYSVFKNEYDAKKVEEYSPEESKNDENHLNDNHPTVYDRLHKDAVARQVKPHSLEKERKNNSFSSNNQRINQENNESNYGVKLYLKSMRKKEETEKKLMNIKKEIYQKQEKELIFVPQTAPPLLSQFKVNRKVEKIGEHLIKMGQNSKDAIEKLKNEKEKEELGQCSFHPQIDLISQKIVVEKSKIMQDNNEAYQSVHERLYNISKENKKNNDSVNYVEELLKTRPNTAQPFKTEMTSFLERMEKLEKMKQEKLEYKKKLGEEQSLQGFHPKIGRSPKIARNTYNAPIGDYLYQKGQEKEEKTKYLLKRENQEMEEKKMKTNEKSNVIFENAKLKKIEEIFNHMDTDKDGKISPNSIDISGVDVYILEKIAPMLCEMEQMNLELDFMDFTHAFNRLAANLSVEEKNKIFFQTKNKWDEKKKSIDNFSFKPEINKKSAKLAEGKKSYENPFSIYEQLDKNLQKGMDARSEQTKDI